MTGTRRSQSSDLGDSDIAAWTPTTADPAWTWADESFAIASQAYSKLPNKKRSCWVKPDRNKPSVQKTCIVISKTYATSGKARLHFAESRSAAGSRGEPGTPMKASPQTFK